MARWLKGPVGVCLLLGSMAFGCSTPLSTETMHDPNGDISEVPELVGDGNDAIDDVSDDVPDESLRGVDKRPEEPDSLVGNGEDGGGFEPGIVDNGPGAGARPNVKVAPPWENAWPDASCSDAASGPGGEWEARNCGMTSGESTSVVAIDAFDRATLYLVARDQLYRSIDRGGSWVSIQPGSDARVHNVVPSSSEPGTLFATGSQAPSIGWFGPGTFGNVLWRSTDHGEHWSVVNNAVPGKVVVAPSDPSVMYAWQNKSEHSSEIARSVDGGQTWTRLVSNEPTKFSTAYVQPSFRLRELIVDPRDPMRYVQLRSNGQVPDMPVVGTLSSKLLQGTKIVFDPRHANRIYFGHPLLGLLRSDDGGAWKVINAESGYFSRLVIDPQHSSRMYLQGTVASLGQGTFVSDDAGKHWRAVTDGQNAVYGSGIALDSSDGERVYISAAGGFYRSRDGLKTLELSNRGLHAFGASLDFDANTRDMVYATTYAGVYRSLDSGRAWQRLQGPTDAMSLVTAPSTAGTAYAASWSRVFKTKDGGQSWTPLAERNNATLRAVAPDDVNVLFANGPTAESPYEKLLKSIDGGQSWTVIPDWTGTYPMGGERIVDQVTSYSPMVVLSAQHLFVAAEALYETIDGGASWRQVPIDLMGVTALAFDSKHPETLYVSGTSNVSELVGGVGTALRISTDGGATWSAPEGAADGTFSAIHSLTVSPADGQLYMIAAAAQQAPAIHLSVDQGATFSSRPLDGAISVTPDPLAPCQALATTASQGVLGTHTAAGMCPSGH